MDLRPGYQLIDDPDAGLSLLGPILSPFNATGMIRFVFFIFFKPLSL